jgi:hypothetical protein
LRFVFDAVGTFRRSGFSFGTHNSRTSKARAC